MSRQPAMANIRTPLGEEYRILLLTVYLLVGTLPMSCSTWVNSDWGDCGYSAYYKTEENAGKTEIVFSQITAEVVGGHRNCGFQYIRTKVDRAEIGGVELPERAESDEFGRITYYYAAPAGFDARNTAIAIQKNGKKYRSDPVLVKHTDINVNVNLDPVWW